MQQSFVKKKITQPPRLFRWFLEIFMQKWPTTSWNHAWWWHTSKNVTNLSRDSADDLKIGQSVFVLVITDKIRIIITFDWLFLTLWNQIVLSKLYLRHWKTLLLNGVKKYYTKEEQSVKKQRYVECSNFKRLS